MISHSVAGFDSLDSCACSFCHRRSIAPGQWCSGSIALYPCRVFANACISAEEELAVVKLNHCWAIQNLIKILVALILSL